MENLFPSILRGVVSNFFNIMLILSLVELKYSKKITYIAFIAIYILITMITSILAIFYDITTFARINLIIWVVFALGCRLLFADSIMKWLFSLVTVLNIFFFIVVISYILSGIFPYPLYANIVIRIILYMIFIILFKKLVYPLYRQVVDKWNLFLSVAAGILINFIYLIITSLNITETFSEKLIPILLLILLMFLVYGTIFWSFGSIIREYELRIEKEQATLQENLLLSQISAHEEFVEASKRYRHDLRHHNQIIMEYLKCDDLKGAKEYLELYDVSIRKSSARNYCKNHIANAVLCLYSQKLQDENIRFVVNADIPKNLNMESPKLGSMLSNIFENALEASKKVNGDERFIIFTAEIKDDSLKIELRNKVSGKVEFINNLPISTKVNGGIGTKSVLHIVEFYKGMIDFKQMNDIFITQIILPA